MNNIKVSKQTLCVHSGTIFDSRTTGVNTPLYNSTSFAYLDTDDRLYPRYFNTPNQQAVIDKICALENSEDGIVFSSGMAAISTTILGLLQRGDHIVFQTNLYGGTFHFVQKDLNNFGIEFTITENNNIESFEGAIKSNTKAIYLETPSNPLLKITDIGAVSQLAKSKGLTTMIDNTFASPINQNPIDLGIDIVLHSATKYLGGHSDICAGVAISSKEFIATIYKMAINLGGSLNSSTCYLLERSLKTLSLRVAQQNTNTLFLAKVLNENPKIDKVYYPGLPSHDGHQIAREQMKGFGGMLSFELNDKLDSVHFQKRLKLIRPSMSLGGVDSIICSPAITSHRHLSKEERAEQGIKDSLLRLSVGIEDPKDLINDIQQAL